MSRGRFWLGFSGAFVVINLIADRYGASLCETNRAAWHLDTPAGRAAFTALYGAGSMVLFKHVMKAQP